MFEHRTGQPRRKFSMEPLSVSHLKEIDRWMAAGGPKEYRPLWHTGEVDSLVMTVNRVAVFCVSFLRMDPPAVELQSSGAEAHIYLLCRPEVHVSHRLSLLAWQAVSVHAFLRMGFSEVQTAVDADRHEENEALLILGYRWVESVREHDCVMNIYSCRKQELRMVM